MTAVSTARDMLDVVDKANQRFTQSLDDKQRAQAVAGGEIAAQQRDLAELLRVAGGERRCLVDRHRRRSLLNVRRS